MLVVRPANKSDLETFIGLARLAGPGFTSLAVSDDDLEGRLEKSEKSFALETDELSEEVYLLMLEDTDTGEVVGLSAVKSQIGMNKPFFNFKVLNVVQSSKPANRHFNMEIILLVNEYSGASEVGTLFVKPKMRGTGAGRLVAQARYMLIATARNRFSETIISELRGRVDETGFSPFWESLGRKFFKMDFNDADKITAETDNQFITDLMPKYPIYTDLLSEEAQSVIGRTHPAGIGARRLLEEEGFRYEHCVDIFDGGPTMAVPRDQARTVRDSIVLTVKADAKLKPNFSALISNERIADFRAVFTKAMIVDDQVSLTPEVVEQLRLKDGDKARVFASALRK